MRSRIGKVERVTSESSVAVEVSLDGSGAADIATGVGFFDHMLSSLARHAGFDLSIMSRGDLHVDPHHTVEDTAIVLGEALNAALGDRAGITRFGDALVPLDEALVQVAVDVSGRPYCVHDEPLGLAPVIGDYDTTLTRHVFESLATSARICLHIRVLAGRNAHHVHEAQFKAVARALRQACAIDPQVIGIPSTKGSL
jgi:imidazoleglycerol-phosphate dehydratase